jgi:hypothetical protein
VSVQQQAVASPLTLLRDRALRILVFDRSEMNMTGAVEGDWRRAVIGSVRSGRGFEAVKVYWFSFAAHHDFANGRKFMDTVQ